MEGKMTKKQMSNELEYGWSLLAGGSSPREVSLKKGTNNPEKKYRKKQTDRSTSPVTLLKSSTESTPSQ
jgi:hypothetical protein